MYCKHCGQPAGEHYPHHHGPYCRVCRERASAGEKLYDGRCPRCGRLVFPKELILCDDCRNQLVNDQPPPPSASAGSSS